MENKAEFWKYHIAVNSKHKFIALVWRFKHVPYFNINTFEKLSLAYIFAIFFQNVFSNLMIL